jgi:hypothetical protein
MLPLDEKYAPTRYKKNTKQNIISKTKISERQEIAYSPSLGTQLMISSSYQSILQ